MKRLSIIMSLLLSFCCACSSEQGPALEISENSVISFRSDPYNSIPSEVFKLTSSDQGTVIKVTSKTSNQTIYLKEQYDFSIYNQDKMFEGKSVRVPMETGKGYSHQYTNSYRFNVESYTAAECMLALELSNGKFLVLSASRRIFLYGIEAAKKDIATTTEGKKIPVLMIVTKPMLNTGDIVLVPIYSPLNSPTNTNADNLQEIVKFDHKLYHFSSFISRITRVLCNHQLNLI